MKNINFKKWFKLKMPGRRGKKIFLIIIGSVALLVALVIIFISPLTKYYIEKNDVKFTGREIKMDWAYVNPFTGYIHLDGLKIYEFKSDSIFLSIDGLSLNFTVYKILSKNYEISSLVLEKPNGKIIEINKIFNFFDIIEKFSTNDKPKKPKEPLHFNILNIKIVEGLFYYSNPIMPIGYYIKNVNIESSGKFWNRDVMNFVFAFKSGIGSGKMNGKFIINTKNLNYNLAVKADTFDLKIIEQYLKAFTQYGKFRAFLNADINASGNFKDAEQLSAKGQIAINDFHFGRKDKEDYASFKQLKIEMIELNPKKKKYIFDSVILANPYFKYERYDSLDNIQQIFGANGNNVKAENANSDKFNLILEIAKYVSNLAQNFLQSDYKVNKFAIYDANIQYIDYTLREKFSIGLNPLTIKADSVNKSRNWVDMKITSGIVPFGNLSVTLHLNPRTKDDFEIHFLIQEVSAPMFNPYLVTYTSFPLNRGNIELQSYWKVQNGKIKSTNHLILLDPRLTKKIKNKDTKWVPMPLIMAFVREYGNVIDYEIPITGDLKDPHFKIRDIIFDLLKNILIKPPSTPYRMDVKNIESKVEKSLTITWPTRQIKMTKMQIRFVEKMAKFLKETPDASISIYPNVYVEKEKEYILFYEAKKKYFLISHNKKWSDYTGNDSLAVEKMSIRDAGFIKYLNSMVKDKLLFTIQQKCSKFIGTDLVTKRYHQLIKNRKNEFLAFFKNDGTTNRIKFQNTETSVPFSGFSYYEIKYKGVVPKYLKDANEDIEQINEEKSRKKYKFFRKPWFKF